MPKRTAKGEKRSSNRPAEDVGSKVAMDAVACLSEDRCHLQTSLFWHQFPRAKRSQIRRTSFRGEASECPVKPSVVAQKVTRKSRKIKTTTNGRNSEVIIPPRSCCRGRTRRQQLNFNSSECPMESNLAEQKLNRKNRKIKQTASDSCSEVIISHRGRSRGQLRRRLNHNSTEKMGLEKLDSSAFQCYLEDLWGEIPEEKSTSFTCLDSLWFYLYSDPNSKKDEILNWIKKKNILSKKYVFVPIVMWSHWSLLILCHFGETDQSKKGARCMLLLDSLRTSSHQQLEPSIRRFISDVYMTEKRLEDREEVNDIPLLAPKIPQQRNDKECGCFVLYYIKLFLEDAPEFFNNSEGYPYFMTEDWFDSEGLECFYQRLESIRKTVNDDKLSVALGQDSSDTSDIEFINTVDLSDLASLTQKKGMTSN